MTAVHDVVVNGDGHRGGDPIAGFLADVAEPVRETLAASQPLREFLAGAAGTLGLPERRLLVEQALVLLDQNYVHLPLKVAMHACNPVQRLRLLRRRLERQTPEHLDPEWAFHTEMSEIFHSVRDLHTNYLLPDPFAGKVAYLPFQVEEFFDDAGAHFVVSHLVQGFSAPGFEPGVEVTHWNGTPIGRAVDRNAARFAGSNAAARHARGLATLTVRPLVMHLPPDEEWVTVGYVGLDGTERELRHPWLVMTNLPTFAGDLDSASTAAASQGLDLEADEGNRARMILFAPEVTGAVLTGALPAATTAPAAAGDEVPTMLPRLFRARSAVTGAGTVAHLRIRTFDVRDPAEFVAEFVRLLGLLPQDGLILDVRDNGGGHIHAAEFTLQTLSPRRIVPEPVQFIATPLSTRICRAHRDGARGIDLGPWLPSLEQAIETGAPYSGAFPITPEAGANDVGQCYQGPVVLVTNARCYSATDIFAAGFADHRIGTILGVDDNTGAGGANVWQHGLLRDLLAGDPDTPYRALPGNANMRVSIRRTLRVGELAGTPVEDLGVVPDERYRMTRRDVLGGNVDLLERAARILADRPRHTMRIEVHPVGAGLRIDVNAVGVDRADIHLDGRPQASIDIVDGVGTATVDGDLAQRVTVRGFLRGELVADADHAPDARRVAARTSTREPVLGAADGSPTVIYVHGAGNKPSRDDLKRAWDHDLFGRDMGDRTRMAYYADVLFGHPAAIGPDGCDIDEALADLPGLAGATGTDLAMLAPTVRASLVAEQSGVLSRLPDRARDFATGLTIDMASRAAGRGLPGDEVMGVLPLPAAVRRLLLQQLLQRLLPDAANYFFGDQRNAMQDRFRLALDAAGGPVVVVAHSLGTAIAYDVLSEPRFAGRAVPLLVTMGSPLGYTEIQDAVTKPLRIPAPVARWANFADQLDVVTLDTTLSDDFGDAVRILDTRVNNPSPNNHAACGYLRSATVRATVGAALPVV